MRDILVNVVTLNGGKHRRKGIYFPYFRICGYEKSLRAIDGVTAVTALQGPTVTNVPNAT
jgi:hypothetical protein